MGALVRFGAKTCDGGPHMGRTMMLDGIVRLLAILPPADTCADYREAVVTMNALGKSTDSNRRESYRRLRELYGLALDVALFTAFRDLASADPLSVPLLAFLVAWSRDPLLRATTPPVLAAVAGARVLKQDIDQALSTAFPGQYSLGCIATITRNAASSWTQSGHLAGHSAKIRVRVQARPAALALALLLGHVGGFHGQELFRSPWCQLLDLSVEQARSLAAQAHREGFLDMRAIGSVVEITFPRFRGLLEDLP